MLFTPRSRNPRVLTRADRSFAPSGPLIEPLEDRQLLSAVLQFRGDAGGVANTGFTGVLATSNGDGLVANKLRQSAGRLLVTTTAGDFNGNVDSQDNALHITVNATRNFTVQARVSSNDFGDNFQNGGIFVGTSEDNYVKLVAGFNNGQGVQMASEKGGAFSSVAIAPRGLDNVRTLDVRLVGKAGTSRLVGWYRVNSNSENAWVRVGTVTTNGNVFAGNAKAGIVTTNAGANPTTVAFDSFSVKGTTDAVNQPKPAPTPTNTAPGTLSVGANVNATRMPGNQVETEIAINPTNPNNVVVVAQNQQNNSASLVVSRSFDGGRTWNLTSIGGREDGLSSGNPRVDPHVVFDAFGNLYVVYEVAASQNELRIIVAKSSNGGQSFTAQTAVRGPGLDVDYPILATGPDATNLNRQTVWVGYQDYNTGRVRMVGARSTGLGNLSAFSAPQTVSDATGSFGSVAVGPQGQVVTAWQTNTGGQGPANVMLDVDADGLGTARTWGRDKFVTRTNVGGFDFIPAQPDRSIGATVGLAFDRSNGLTRGRLFMVYTDENGNESNNTDVYLKYSNDLGSTWNAGIKVNNDNTNKSQFIPAMAVDPTSGEIAIVWKDARNSPNNNTAELWGTVSIDHGNSVRGNARISGGMSNQAAANGQAGDDLDFGDYQGVAFHNGRFVAVWADNSNSTRDNPNGTTGLDLYTSIVTVA